jgi:hypothetical protein
MYVKYIIIVRIVNLSLCTSKMAESCKHCFIFLLWHIWSHPGSWRYHRGLTLHGVLPSFVGREWPGRCDLYCDGRSVPPALPYVFPALAGAAQLRADSISSCSYIVNVHN